MLRRVIIPSLLVVLSAPVGHAEPPAHFDERALRYYASTGQKDRVAAETARLQKIDPSWQVPDDLYAAKPGRADEEPLWELYAQGRLEDLANAIAIRQAADPAWQPSEDLTTKIKTKALRAQIMTLAKSEDWRSILRSFEATGIAWAKDDAEALWVIAEAYAREKNCDEAYVVYRLILAEHQDAAERRATIEHAIAFIPMALTEKLIAMGRKDAVGRGEFDPIETDITRARISAFLHDEPANDVSGDELQRFQEVIRASSNPNESGLMAWYAYKRHDYSQALDWFKLAISRGGDAMVAHGLAHTLRKLGMRREAEEVAYAWREPLVNNAILFIDLLEEDLTKEQPPSIEPARITRYAQVTLATESGEGAQALAWYAYNSCQYPMALKWFERAVAWLPKEATVYGYALALQRSHRPAEFRDVVNRYDGLFPKVVGLAFDDGIRRPPPACETGARQPASASEVGSGGTRDWAGRTMADTLRPEPVPSREIARQRVPSPDGLFAGENGPVTLRKKTPFPLAVQPENALRFSALQTVTTDAEMQDRPGAVPLVARRVPGVGAMPYERYGFTLLPGYDGTREPSAPPAAERGAPAGTAWALEQSLRDGAKTGSAGMGAESLSRRPMVKANSEAMAHPDRRT